MSQSNAPSEQISETQDPAIDILRISFLLDLKVHPELKDLAKKKGHGERPRELLRLAKLGVQRAQEEKQILEQIRSQHAVVAASVLERPAPAISSAMQVGDKPVSEASHSNAAPATPSSQPPAATQGKPASPENNANSSKNPTAQAPAKAMGSFLA